MIAWEYIAFKKFSHFVRTECEFLFSLNMEKYGYYIYMRKMKMNAELIELGSAENHTRTRTESER